MSFDLRLVNGDLDLDGTGALTQVTDTDKLVQDVIRGLNTTLGDDPFKTGFGTNLGTLSIGTAPNLQILLASIENAVRNVVLDIQSYQQQQKLSGQNLSAAEELAEIGQISVAQDLVEPRQINIFVEVLSRDITPIQFQFSIGISNSGYIIAKP